jgi:hypothetical protein
VGFLVYLRGRTQTKDAAVSASIVAIYKTTRIPGLASPDFACKLRSLDRLSAGNEALTTRTNR